MTVVITRAAALTSCSSSPNPIAKGTAKARSVSTTPGPKAEMVDGVPLIPNTAAQRSSYVKFSDQLNRKVLCQGLLPEPIPVS